MNTKVAVAQLYDTPSDEVRVERVTTEVLVVPGDSEKAGRVYDAVLEATGREFIANRAARRFGTQRIIINRNVEVI